MKKTVTTPCAAALALLMFMWMGIAEGWNELLTFALFLAALLCLGITWGDIAFEIYHRAKNRKRGGE